MSKEPQSADGNRRKIFTEGNKGNKGVIGLETPSLSSFPSVESLLARNRSSDYEKFLARVPNEWRTRIG